MQFAVSASITVVCIVILRTGPIGFFIGGVASSFLAMVSMAVLARRLFVPITEFRQVVEHEGTYLGANGGDGTSIASF